MAGKIIGLVVFFFFFSGIFRAARSIFAFSKLWLWRKPVTRARLRVIGRYAIRAGTIQRRRHNQERDNTLGTIFFGINADISSCRGKIGAHVRSDIRLSNYFRLTPVQNVHARARALFLW